MGIESDVKKLIKIDAILKQGLEDEVAAMKEIYVELTSGLKQMKEIISQINFDQIKEESAEAVLNPAKQAIDSFIVELSPLEELDARFNNVKEHTTALKKSLEGFKNTLAVYGSSEKAVIDFDSNVVYAFKTTILRDFQQDIDFNKRIEEALS